MSERLFSPCVVRRGFWPEGEERLAGFLEGSAHSSLPGCLLESNYRADAKNEMANSAISLVAVSQLPGANRKQRNPDDGARALFVARKLP